MTEGEKVIESKMETCRKHNTPTGGALTPKCSRVSSAVEILLAVSIVLYARFRTGDGLYRRYAMPDS